MNDREATERFLRFCDTAPRRWQDTLNARFKMFGIARNQVTNDERG